MGCASLACTPSLLPKLFHFAQVTTSLRRILNRNPPRTSTLLFVSLLKHFIATARGLASSFFVVEILCRQQILCCQSESGTTHKWAIWQFTPHCWKDSCYPSSWVKTPLVSRSARSLTLKYIFLFAHARQQDKLEVSMLIRKYFSTCMILLQQMN